jgi:hypothetical protein
MGVGLIILNQKKYFAETTNDESEKKVMSADSAIDNEIKPDPDSATGQED